MGRDVAKSELEGAVAIEGGRPLDGGGLALNMGEDGADFGNIAADVRLKLGDEIVRLAEGHGLCDFKVLLQVEAVARLLLEGEVVNGEVGACGNGADAVVDGLGGAGGGDGVNDDVRRREGEAGPRRWRRP